MSRQPGLALLNSEWGSAGVDHITLDAVLTECAAQSHVLDRAFTGDHFLQQFTSGVEVELIRTVCTLLSLRTLAMSVRICGPFNSQVRWRQKS